MNLLSRRALLAGAAGVTACGPKLAKRYNGFALVANHGSQNAIAVSLTSFKAEKLIPLNSRPADVMAHAAGRAALLLLPDTGTVAQITAEALAVTQQRKLADRLIAANLPSAGHALFLLAREPAALLRLDLQSWQRTLSHSLAHAPGSFDIAPDGATAVVTYPAQKQCALLDLGSRSTLSMIELAAEPGIVRFRPDGKQVLVGSAAARTVTIADAASGKVLVILPMPFAPERFCFSTDNGGQMFVTGRGMDAVAIVYPYQTEVAETVLAGREPGAMTVNDSLLFVTNPPTGDTTVISIAERQVVARIASGEEPCAVTLTPDGEYALVLNRKSGDMAVARLSKLTDRRYKRAPLFTVIAVGEEPVAVAVISN